MTTKEIEKEMVAVKKEKRMLQAKYLKPLTKKIEALEKARIASIIRNKEYLTDLSKYEDQQLSSIKAINSNQQQGAIYRPPVR